MSVSLINHAFKSKLPTVQKFVLVALCDHADNAGQCFPSISRLAARCSISERHVFNCLKELEKNGYIVRRGRTGRNTIYHIASPEAWAAAPGSPLNVVHSTPEPGSPLNVVHPTPERGSPLNVVHPTPEPGSPPLLIDVLTTNEPPIEPSGEPPIEPSGNRQRQKRAKKESPEREQKQAIEEYTAKAELRRALFDFKTMRRQMCKPMTGRALQLLLKKLDAMSNGDDGLKIQLLEQSILKAWQDIYPLQNGGQTPWAMPCN